MNPPATGLLEMPPALEIMFPGPPIREADAPLKEHFLHAPPCTKKKERATDPSGGQISSLERDRAESALGPVPLAVSTVGTEMKRHEAVSCAMCAKQDGETEQWSLGAPLSSGRQVINWGRGGVNTNVIVTCLPDMW